MNNPFQVFNAAAEELDKIESFCVDRSNELKICIPALTEKYHNILLYGTRGVGKTFLVRLIENRLRKYFPTAFVGYVKTMGLLSYGNIDPIASFSRATLLQICSAIWTELMEKSYLDLRDRLNESGQEINFRSEPEKVLQRIYSLLMKPNIRTQQQMVNTIGFTAGVKGEKKETNIQDFQQSDILPFEFAELTHELKKKVLKPLGRERLIILCDEANHMPIFQQEAILERYFDLFKSKQVQFLFVAGFMPWETEMPVPSCFETQLQLNGFPDKSFIKELIDKFNCKDIVFEESSIEVLFDYFKGHPRFSMQLCSIAFQVASVNSIHNIDGVLMARLCKEFDCKLKEEEKIYKEMLTKRCT